MSSRETNRLQTSNRMFRWDVMYMIKISTNTGIGHAQKADNTEGCEKSWVMLMQECGNAEI